MKQWNDLLQKIDALTLRERVILFVLMLAGLWAVLDAALLAPQERASKEEQQKIKQARLQLAEAEQVLLMRATAPDPARDARQRLEMAQKTLETRLQAASSMQARLVAPKDQVRVLQGLLGAQPGLRLSRLETLPPEPVSEPVANPQAARVAVGPAVESPASKPAEAPPAALYKHGVTLTLTGSYDALTRYMERLEHLPLGFYWARAELDAGGHPEISLTLTLYTLSLERTWLTV